MIAPSYVRDANGNLVKHEQGLALQVMRASGTGDITRAQAHEAPEGYAYPWQLVAYAICADTPPGYEVVDNLDNPAGSDDSRYASAVCPEHWVIDATGVHEVRWRPLGMGATVGNAPGNVALTGLIAMGFRDGTDTRSSAAEITATNVDWSLASEVICVY